MDEAIMTFAFLILAIIGTIIRVILPLTLIAMGVIRMRKVKTNGKPILIFGIIYMLISVGYYIYSAIMYGA